MKKFLSLIVVASLCITSCTKENRRADDLIPHVAGVEDNPNGGGGQNTTAVPAAVLAAFTARYPDAAQIQWKKLSDGTFKAEFLRGAVKWQVIFTAAGAVVKEEHN